VNAVFKAIGVAAIFPCARGVRHSIDLSYRIVDFESAVQLTVQSEFSKDLCADVYAIEIRDTPCPPLQVQCVEQRTLRRRCGCKKVRAVVGHTNATEEPDPFAISHIRTLSTQHATNKRRLDETEA
jgi:hypothetical protein